MIEETKYHPETGALLHRDIRPVTLHYKNQSITINMPGWFPDDDGDALFSQDDLKVSDGAVKTMKIAYEKFLFEQSRKKIKMRG